MRRPADARLGEDLRTLRTELDFSQDELAEELGISRATVLARENRAWVTEAIYQQHKAKLIEMDQERSKRFHDLT